MARLQRQLGLDQHLLLQLGRWYWRLLQGDLGQSIFLRRPVVEAILDRAEPTLLLTSLATLVAVLIGVPAGIVAARRHGALADQALMLLALLGTSVPNFLLGLLLMPGVRGVARLAPGRGVRLPGRRPWRTLRSLLMPAFALGVVQSALIARITRSAMLDVLREQFILAGRAKGLDEREVVYKHALKNAFVPILTVIGISFAVLLGGAVVIEQVFNIPGVGRLIIQAVLRRDYPVIQGVILIVGGIYVLVNLVVDLAYLLLDPRIRYQ